MRVFITAAMIACNVCYDDDDDDKKGEIFIARSKRRRTMSEGEAQSKGGSLFSLDLSPSCNFFDTGLSDIKNDTHTHKT